MMLAYPPFFYPKNENEIYEFTKAVCDSVNLAVTAYASHKYNFERFHGSPYNPDLLVRIADIENVVAIKMGTLDHSHITQCFKMVGDKALLGMPFPQHWSTYVLGGFDQQWAGSAPYELIQNPDKPYLVDYFNLLREGKLKEAMDIYWKIYPALELFGELVEPTVRQGNYNIMHWKYFGWLNGLNGGPIPLSTSRLYEHEKIKLKKVLKSIGLTPREPDEEFYVGRVNYSTKNK